jgi:hypothetical protein
LGFNPLGTSIHCGGRRSRLPQFLFLPSHHALVWQLEKGDVLLRREYENVKLDLREISNRIENEIENFNKDKVIISSEYFSSLCSQDVQSVRQLLNSYSVKIIIYLEMNQKIAKKYLDRENGKLFYEDLSY